MIIKRGLPMLRDEWTSEHEPWDLIPGYRVTYLELDNICKMMQERGWSGLIGLDEAVAAEIGRDVQLPWNLDIDRRNLR